MEDFGTPPIEPALSILVKSLELEADLHPLGRFLMRVHLRELLETRLRLAHAWSGVEALEASLIVRPLFIDVKYSELVSDPLAVVRRVYKRLDIRLTDAAAQRMQRLVLSRSRYESRGASPTSADFGLDCSAEAQRFEGYCSRFGIPCQHS